MIPAAALRHIEALLVPLVAGATVLVIVAGAAIAVRRARIVRRLHVFGRRVG